MSKNIAKRFGHEVFKPVDHGRDSCPNLVDWVASLKCDDPARLAAVMADLRRPRGVSAERYGIALHKGGRTPMLNADKMAVERSMSKHFDEHGSKHAKLKCIKRVLIKPESGPAAKIAGTWAMNTWEVWSLQFSPGLILRDHKGNESDVFPGWGKLKSALEQIGFKLIRQEEG